MVEIKSCPVCGSFDLNFALCVKDHSISQEEFNLSECNNCSFVITSPRPDNNELGRYYQSENYISHSGKGNSLVNTIYLRARAFSLQWKLKLINKYKTGESLLDIGCGTGEFLKIIKQNGFSVEGVEPNDSARSKASQLLNQNINRTLDEVKGLHDSITLWHVLEHLPDLNESIQSMASLLKGAGLLLIAVPNHASKDANHYNKLWAGYDVPRHLWHFNRKSMATLLQKHGLVIQSIVPMKLDSFYVSMLSEKYLGSVGMGSLMSGFIHGLSSNLSARKSGEYSSLIYIAKK